MRITILHPTCGRKEIAMKTMFKWLSLADKPFGIEYIFSVDNSDSDIWHSRIDLFPKTFSTTIMSCTVVKNDNRSAIDAINNAAKMATGDLLIVVSDDTDCQCNWDTKLLNNIRGRTDFLAKTVDGLQPTLVTMPVMDRIYYKRYGYIYHPDYKHMFCDQELTAVAIMTGKYIKLPILFEHLHYSAGLSAKDDINIKNDATWHQGETLFNERLKNNFGIDNPVVEYKDIVWR